MQRFFDIHKKRYQILLFALIAAVFVACTLGMLLFQMHKFSKESIFSTVEAVSEQRKHEINTTFDYRLKNLKILAKFFEKLQIENKDDFITNLAQYKDSSIYDFIFFAGKDGIAINNTGETYPIQDTLFFKQSINGSVSIYSPHVSPVDETDGYTTISVPVIDEKGSVIGIIGGTCRQKHTNEIFLRKTTGNVVSFLVDKDHNVIAHSDMENEDDEIYKVVQNFNLAENMSEKEIIRISGNRYFVVFDSMPQNGWFLISLAAASEISKQYFAISLWGVLASLLNLFAFLFVIVAMVFIYSKYLKQIEDFAFIDPVTNGISYQKFLSEAEKYLNYHRNGSILAVCIDINDFRIFNDLYGFEEGNALLARVYRALVSFFKSGIVCRASNDTFYLITDFKATKDELLRKKDLFTDSFNAALEKNKKPYHITFTAGFYQLEEFTTQVFSIIERANHVHTCAKKEGVTNIFFQESLRQGAIRQKIIENSMHEAFANLEFQMYLQPKCELVSRHLVGAEALVRWESEKTGNQYPNEFIPVFEKTGFIVQLDLYMMECTCQLLRHWIDFGIEPVPISVNQSKLLLLNPIYFNVITTTIEKYNLPPRLIEVEITETIMYDNTEALNELISKLHAYGVRVSIDDFGSGYSSLLLIRDIKADILKIDKSFVYKAENDTIGKKILSSIIQLADTLNMQILAEGIETEDQLSMLADLGCHEGQGYLFGRPVPAETFAKKFHDTL